MLDVREHEDTAGHSPFSAWFAGLDAAAAAEVRVAVARIEQDNLSNATGLEEGGMEYRLDFGLGYWVYFGRDGDVLGILLAGVPSNVSNATSRWLRGAGPTTSGVNGL